MSRPANKIARNVRAIFNQLGFWCQHISADLNPGIPDLLACGEDYYWIEIKSKHDVDQPSQNAWRSVYKSQGGQNWYRLRELSKGFDLESIHGYTQHFDSIKQAVHWILMPF
jgi:hypothetical protein